MGERPGGPCLRHDWRQPEACEWLDADIQEPLYSRKAVGTTRRGLAEKKENWASAMKQQSLASPSRAWYCRHGQARGKGNPSAGAPRVLLFTQTRRPRCDSSSATRLFGKANSGMFQRLELALFGFLLCSDALRNAYSYANVPPCSVYILGPTVITASRWP